jgi:gliding motility-associated-like protein
MLSNQAVTTIPTFFNPSGPVVGFLWEGPSPEIPKQLSSSYIGSSPGVYTLTVKDMNNGCLSVVTATVPDNRIYPIVNIPEAPPPFVIDCGMESVKIYGDEAAPLARYTYSWDPVTTATVSGANTRSLTTNRPGVYIVNITDPENGCTSSGFLSVVTGTLTADIEAVPNRGFAPLEVKLNNKSATTLNNENIISLWHFGNGSDSLMKQASSVNMLYEQAGTYTVVLWASKGDCTDSASYVIHVDVPSSVEIPDIFTPNGDNVNDVFFIKMAGLQSLHFTVFDRWGQRVYELNSSSGIEWNGKNQQGVNVAEGVYFYTATAKGNDGKEFDLKGNVTLVR